MVVLCRLGSGAGLMDIDHPKPAPSHVAPVPGGLLDGSLWECWLSCKLYVNIFKWHICLNYSRALLDC